MATLAVRDDHRLAGGLERFHGRGKTACGQSTTTPGSIYPSIRSRSRNAYQYIILCKTMSKEEQLQKRLILSRKEVADCGLATKYGCPRYWTSSVLLP